MKEGFKLDLPKPTPLITRGGFIVSEKNGMLTAFKPGDVLGFSNVMSTNDGRIGPMMGSCAVTVGLSSFILPGATAAELLEYLAKG